MKNVTRSLFVFVFVLLLAVTADAKDFSTWLYGNDTSLGVRVGYNITDKVEAGIESCWLGGNNVPQVWAGYGIYKTDEIQVPNPIPLDFLPKTLSGVPYLGVQAGLNIDNQGTFVGPIAGVIVENILVVEYQYLSTDFDLKSVDNKQSVLLGLRFEF